MDLSVASTFSFLLLPARFSSGTTAPSFYLVYKLFFFFLKSLASVCCAVNSECEQGCSQVVAMNSQLDEGNYSFLLLRSRYFSIDSALLTLPCLFFLPPPTPALSFRSLASVSPSVLFSVLVFIFQPRLSRLRCVDLVQFSAKKETRETP